MTTTYRVLTEAITANVVTLGLSSVAGLYVGYHVRVDEAPHTDGNHILTAVDSTLNTVTFSKNHQNVAEADVWAQLYVEVTWCDETDVEQYLGVAPAEQVDEDYLTACVVAGNTWCWDRRAAAGYSDLPQVAPSPKVQLGAVLKCAELYRSRGSVDGFSSFQNLEGVAPIGTNVEVLRLLGINRPAIA
jgi:hypothetical protein